MKHFKKSFFVTILLIILSSLFPQNVSFASDRISGTSRYETAVEVSKKGWIDGANTVVLAKGTNFPDALAGGPLAFKLNAPILLTNSTSLPSTTKNEIIRLGANKIVILGGEGAISKSVENSLTTLGINVERISGKDRYETAAKIAERLSSEYVIIANGNNYPDALAISPYAAKNGIPILLTKKDQLPISTENALRGKIEAKVVGGNFAISEKVMAKLPSPTRFSGENRYATNSMIVSRLKPWGNRAYIATGTNFADALTGSVLAAKNNAPILLISNESIPINIYNLLNQFTDFNVLGGESAINDNLFKEIISFEPIEAPPVEVPPIEEPPINPYTYLELNTPYTSLDNEMTVTMNSIEVAEYDGYYEYKITYSEENKTNKIIDQGSFKIFYNDESSEPQYGFFNVLYPGQSASRSYTFTSLKEKESLLLEYGADLFFNQTPSENTLKWKLVR